MLYCHRITSVHFTQHENRRTKTNKKQKKEKKHDKNERNEKKTHDRGIQSHNATQPSTVIWIDSENKSRDKKKAKVPLHLPLNNCNDM